MTVVHRGRLHGADDVPAGGELHLDLAALAGVRVQEILSGAVAEPMRFRSDEHEWVVVLAGSARLELAGEVHRLTAGEWLVIPAGTPHTVDLVEPGTRWLAVLVPRDPPDGVRRAAGSALQVGSIGRSPGHSERRRARKSESE